MPLLGARSTRTWSVYNAETNTWVDGRGTRRPMDFRDYILYEWPNGGTTLTGLTSQLAKEKLTDPHFHWFLQEYIPQAGPATGIFSNVGLTVPYPGGATLGTPVYIQIAQDTTQFFRIGHTVILRDTANPEVYAMVEVTGVVPNGANSYIAGIFLHTDPIIVGGPDASTANLIAVSGNANAENAAMPSALSYDPTLYNNFSQIFRTPLELSRTAIETTLRGEQPYTDMKKQALKFHALEMEKAFIWGLPSVRMLGNMPQRTTGGLFYYARRYGQTYNWLTDLGYANGAGSWVDQANGGNTWLDNSLENIFRFGSKERMAFCGEAVLTAINTLVKTNNMTQFTITAMTEEFGVRVSKWVTPHGVINFVTHPLFRDSGDYRTAIIFDLTGSKYRFLHDTDFFADDPKKNTGHGRIDGKKEEYLTECGLEWGHPSWQAVLFNFGLDRP